MTRSESLKRFALWAVVVAVFTGVMYFPTLTGGSPWSWHVGEFSPLVTLLVGFTAGLFSGHFWWPRTDRWPELEREVARYWNHTGNQRHGCSECDKFIDQLGRLVRPHVLERER